MNANHWLQPLYAVHTAALASDSHPNFPLRFSFRLARCGFGLLHFLSGLGQERRSLAD